MSGIDQKEYLKKYLGIGKGSGEKKKKKKPKKTLNGLKIVDDDIDVNINEEIQQDLTADNEEAPQIVSIIDDRPPSLRIDEVTHDKLWKAIGAPEPSSDKTLKFEGSIKLSRQMESLKKYSTSKLKNKRNASHLKGNDFSPPRSKEANHGSGSDSSPPRNKINKDNSPPRRGRTHDDDSLPSRRIKREKSEDNSPPRRNRREKSEDSSPPRKRKIPESDSSPPRRIKREKSEDNSPPRRSRREKSEDNSPLRKGKAHKDDSSPPRRSRREKSEDRSPPRKKIHDNDASPPRRIKREKSEDNSPPRRSKKHDINASPPRKSKNTSKPARKSRWGDFEEPEDKMQKTLDGKKAGLQNAADLVLETRELKSREDELFRNMSAEVSGSNAATIVRGKKKEVDWEEEERKRKREAENKEKYDRWGKGLKQVEDSNEKMKNELYEMSKPLARYADDEDLEKYLKDQERAGDPMLAYIKQKKKKKLVEEGKPSVHQYQGDAPPNRFGIRPGYRWDGVDRSTGYEKQWFQVQNSRMASLEETYKWSTEDM